jgi:hypothetical protein
MARSGNNPKRRIAEPGHFAPAVLETFADQLAYVGSANHKRFPGDYRFQPAVNPRGWKSLCDRDRVIPLSEARQLLRDGILKGMISTHFDGDTPKYVWSVDANSRPYEAKLGLGGYHGYMLEAEDNMAEFVLQAWAKR